MTTIRQLEARDFKRSGFFGRPLPRRPDGAIFCSAIPFFYVGRNRYGFWVAREEDGKIGGLFMRKRSALHFVRAFSEPSGCATMFLNEPFELDVENRGGWVAALLSAAMEGVARRLPTVATFVGLMVAEWRKLVAEIARALAGVHRNRAAIEHDLFAGNYWLSSKNDDDLPVR